MLAAVGLGLGCDRGDPVIPRVEGPLKVEVRYPTGDSVAATDSISVWGSLGTGRATLRINKRRVRVERNGAFAAFVPLPAGPSPALELEARAGRESVHRTVPVPRARPRPVLMPTVRPLDRWVVIHRPPSDTTDAATQARPVFSRWTPGGALALPLPQGLRLRADAEVDDAIRIRLARGWMAWVPRDEAQSASVPGRPPRIAAIGLAETAGGWRIDAVVSERLATHVDVLGDRIRWTLFGAASGAVAFQPRGPVRAVGVRDPGDGRVVLEVQLREPPLGWRVTWSRGAMHLEFRERPPPGRGVRGLVVALDPGHPPGGSTGPSGLREDSVTLAVARAAARRLEQLGARVILTRRDERPVSIDQRLALAEAANAHVFISIHVNALGDGGPPESVDGTRAYWLDASQLQLAQMLRDSVAAATRQLPVSTVQSQLAVLRATWFRSVLVEGTALVLPAREAYLRTAAGIDAYAAGLVGGLTAWVEAPRPRG